MQRRLAYFDSRSREWIAKRAELCNNVRVNSENEKIYSLLEEMHGNAECELDFRTPFQLLVAVILSAQCTDKRVNMITPKLFEVASTPEDFVALPTEELEKLIFSCGFYHNKAKAIKQAAASIVERGGMPTTQEELMKLSGVGRKTANVVYAVAYGGNAIAVDTHVFRVANRIGIVEAKTPEETERQLMAAFDEDKWSKLHHLLIFQGRYTCHSQNPDCAACKLTGVCKYYKNRQKV